MTSTPKSVSNANLFARLFDGLDDPSRLAIETHDNKRITYGDLIAMAGRMANVLIDRGVKIGDRVAAQTEKSVSGLVLYLATVRAGAVYLPLNTALHAERTRLFHHRRRTDSDRLRSGESRRAARHRRKGECHRRDAWRGRQGHVY